LATALGLPLNSALAFAGPLSGFGGGAHHVGTKGVISGLGFHPTIVERPRNKLEAITAARAAFARCQFDERGCDLCLRRLRAYRKEWDESRGVWKDRPRHDDSSHGADAFLTFACSNHQPPFAYVHRRRILRGIV